MSDWIETDKRKQGCPVDGEQMVEVRWINATGITTHRAGALNWDIIEAYRLIPNPVHSR